MSSTLNSWSEKSTPTTTQDDVERTLLQAYSLIESAVSRHRAGENRDLVVESTRGSQSTTAAAEMVGNARRELVYMIPPDSMSIIRHGTVNDTLSRLGSKGVRVRLLCSPENLEIDRGKWNSFVPDDLVRVIDCPPMELMIVDSNSALIRNTLHLAEGQAIILHDQAIVSSLYALFNSAWTLASSAVHHPNAFDRRHELERQVLTFLNRGKDDEAAAREIGISVRTYRRYVAKIMQQLGASSRFQAGALASKFGLINPECHRSATTPRSRR
jgi:DNA-binding CsgD family transcriptional regulator